MKIPIEISARHIHLSKMDFEKICGKKKQIVLLKKLSQPGEFATQKTLPIINGKRKIDDMRVVGPFRKKSQVELALTDAYDLNLKPLPDIKLSGNLGGSPKITVKGKKSSLKIPVIIAQRHLHCSEEKAKKLKIKNNQKVSIKIDGKRGLTFHNVVVRLSKEYKLGMHIDTDEANAANIRGKTFGKIVRWVNQKT